jgi:hypothetical protein
MNYLELAKFIRENYTPFAFTCDCNEVSCVSIRQNDVYANAQNDVVQKIANAIAGMESA